MCVNVFPVDTDPEKSVSKAEVSGRAVRKSARLYRLSKAMSSGKEGTCTVHVHV